MCIDLTVRMEPSTCVANAANWGNIELAGIKLTYRPLPHRCETHITTHSRQHIVTAAVHVGDDSTKTSRVGPDLRCFLITRHRNSLSSWHHIEYTANLAMTLQ